MVSRSSKYRVACGPICTWRFFLCAMILARKSLRCLAYCSSGMSLSRVSFCMVSVLMKYSSGLVLPFEGNNGFVGKQIIAQFLVEPRVAAADPLQHPGGMLLFLAALLRE